MTTMPSLIATTRKHIADQQRRFADTMETSCPDAAQRLRRAAERLERLVDA